VARQSVFPFLPRQSSCRQPADDIRSRWWKGLDIGMDSPLFLSRASSLSASSCLPLTNFPVRAGGRSRPPRPDYGRLPCNRRFRLQFFSVSASLRFSAFALALITRICPTFARPSYLHRLLHHVTPLPRSSPDRTLLRTRIGDVLASAGAFDAF